MAERRSSTKVNYLSVFEDTLSQCISNSYILDSILSSKKSFQVYKSPIEIYDLPTSVKKNNILLLNCTSLEAVELINNISESKTTLLDFASATTPGGGVLLGSNGQEEELCRLTSLYLILNSDELKESYYYPNKRLAIYKEEALIADATVVYIPDVKIIKCHEGRRLSKSNYTGISVIVCAAPNLRNISPPDNVILEKYIYERACQILKCAIKNDCKNIILGAHGCGAFRNPIEIVAKAYCNAILEHNRYFDNILLAIPDTDKLDVFGKYCFSRNSGLGEIFSLRRDYCNKVSSFDAHVPDSVFEKFLSRIAEIRQNIENLEALSLSNRQKIISGLLLKETTVMNDWHEARAFRRI